MIAASLRFALIGLGIGFVGGTLGIGGSVLLVPLLMGLFPSDFDHLKAAGTTLAALSVPVFIPAVIRYFSRGQVHIPAALAIAAGLALGAFTGASLVIHFPRAGIRIAFGLLLIYIGGQYVFATLGTVRAVAASALLVGASWLAYWACLTVGKRYQPKRLADELRQRLGDRHEPEYYI